MGIKYVRKTIDAPIIMGLDEPDWPALINDICGQAIPKKQIAEACDMTRQVLYSIIDGTSKPHWLQGQLLLNLHNSVVPAKQRRQPSMLSAMVKQL